MFKTSFAAPNAARCAADLRWLLQSPPLLSLAPQRFSAAVQSFDAAQASALAVWLHRVDAEHLHAFVAQVLPAKAPMRLGRYAERLMEYALRHSPLFELIAANVPLRRALSPSDSHDDRQHTTVGEFDYLLRDAQGKHWHWEMAVKFYLCHPASSAAVPHDFKGPAGKDTLGVKLGKVFGKQLQHLPPAPYDTAHWQPAAYARGWMFYPHGQAPTACDALNPVHLKGWWLPHAAFTLARFDSAHFVHLPRLYWLAPYAPYAPYAQDAQSELPVLTQAQMGQHLSDYWRSADITGSQQAQAGQLLACVVPSEHGWRELRRGFVMPASPAPCS